MLTFILPIATPSVPLANNWYTSGKSTGALVLELDPLKFLRPRRIGTRTVDVTD